MSVIEKNLIQTPRVWSESLPKTEHHCVGRNCPNVSLPGLDRCPRCTDTGEIVNAYISTYHAAQTAIKAAEIYQENCEGYKATIDQLEGSAWQNAAWRITCILIGILVLADLIHRIGGA